MDNLSQKERSYLQNEELEERQEWLHDLSQRAQTRIFNEHPKVRRVCLQAQIARSPRFQKITSSQWFRAAFNYDPLVEQ